MEVKNAKIVSTTLGKEDHGIMTFYITIEAHGWGCSIGGYALSGKDPVTGEYGFCGEGLEAIARICEVVGVNKWEDLPGKYIRVKDNSWGSTIDEIGNLIDEKWFNLRDFFSKDGSK